MRLDDFDINRSNHSLEMLISEMKYFEEHCGSMMNDTDVYKSDLKEKLSNNRAPLLFINSKHISILTNTFEI